MTRSKKTIINILIILLLFPLLMYVNGLYFSPLVALHASERDLHYGPSQIVHSFDLDGKRYFLGTYDNYITFSPIKRSLKFFWAYGGGFGLENPMDVPFFANYRRDDDNWLVYGAVNDPKIKEIKLEVVSSLETPAFPPSSISIEDFYEGLFYSSWKMEDSQDWDYFDIRISLKAFDSDGLIVDEIEF